MSVLKKKFTVAMLLYVGFQAFICPSSFPSALVDAIPEDPLSPLNATNSFVSTIASDPHELGASSQLDELSGDWDRLSHLSSEATVGKEGLERIIDGVLIGINFNLGDSLKGAVTLKNDAKVDYEEVVIPFLVWERVGISATLGRKRFNLPLEEHCLNKRMSGAIVFKYLKTKRVNAFDFRKAVARELEARYGGNVESLYFGSPRATLDSDALRAKGNRAAQIVVYKKLDMKDSVKELQAISAKYGFLHCIVKFK